MRAGNLELQTKSNAGIINRRTTKISNITVSTKMTIITMRHRSPSNSNIILKKKWNRTVDKQKSRAGTNNTNRLITQGATIDHTRGREETLLIVEALNIIEGPEVGTTVSKDSDGDPYEAPYFPPETVRISLRSP